MRRLILMTAFAFSACLPAAAWCNGNTLEKPLWTLRQIDVERRAIEMCADNWFPSCEIMFVQQPRPVLQRLNNPDDSGCITEETAPAVHAAIESLLRQLKRLNERMKQSLETGDPRYYEPAE